MLLTSYGSCWHGVELVNDHSGDSVHVFEEFECTGGTEGLQVLGVAKLDVLLVMTPKLALLDLSPA